MYKGCEDVGSQFAKNRFYQISSRGEISPTENIFKILFENSLKIPPDNLKNLSKNPLKNIKI